MSRKGVPLTEEHRSRISKAMRANPAGLENIRQGRKRWWRRLSPEEKAAETARLRSVLPSDAAQQEARARLWADPAQRKRQSDLAKGLWRRPGFRENFVEKLKRQHASLSPEEKSAYRQQRKDWWASLSPEEQAVQTSGMHAYQAGLATKEARAANTAAARAARPPEVRSAQMKEWWANLSSEERAVQSARVKAWWAGLSDEEKESHIRKQRPIARPNRLEAAVQSYLDARFPGEWKYNNGEFVIASKVPDFVNVNGRKALLEIFGDHWHQGEDPADRKKIFRKVGYACAVVWESEFRKDPGIVSKRLRALRK